MRSRIRKRSILMGCMVLLISASSIVFFAVGYLDSRHITSGDVIPNNDEVIALIRQGLRDHSKRITVTFEYGKDILPELNRFVEEWIEAAMQETAEPTEGDYIRYQCGGYESYFNCDVFGGRYYYTVEIVPQYYMYLFQEQMVTEKLDEIFEGFGFNEDTSDYERVCTIYDYICGHVSYDMIHQKNPYYYMRSTSYAALIQETATCQGYCVALYRMLRQAGINSRIITGTGYEGGFGGLHAWNIVELGGVYYNLDATWDAGKDTYTYFLVGGDSFENHTPGSKFSEQEFMKRYPISDEDY